jgi:signal transduction histidine kinase
MEPPTTVPISHPIPLLEALPHAAWACDSHGRMTAANGYWKRYVGSTGALRSWLSDRIVHPQDVGGLRDLWHDARENGSPIRADARLRRFDGSWRWNVLQLGPVARDARVSDWLATCTDVDELRPNDDVPQPIDVELERLRTDIVTTVGHELRTPLTSIYGMAVTLQQRDATLSRRSREQLLSIIVDQSMRMTATIDDVLAASSIERGTLHLRVRTCELGSIVRSVVGTLDAASHCASIELARPCPRLEVSVDPGRLRQALANLVENAVKYSPGGTGVLVRIRRAGDVACVDVSDQGIGISSADQPQVFDRFRRIDPSLVRGVAGSGLGLYIARELARRMGGEVTVRSHPGRGSTFTLRLPTVH